ncbi:MAG: hypothetical protein WHS46_08175 [Desulfosoma sp.]
MSIPLLIGIIGHRKFPEEYRCDLEAELSQALDEIRSQVPNTPVVLVSSLAVGADRLGAKVGLAKGMKLIVPLPFEKVLFEQDFPGSENEFENLLAQAQSWFVATESEFCGYEGASRWIARHCQIIIALWDGKQEEPAPGGTAHTVQLRTKVGESGHTLSSVADYIGPVLHIHCPRNPCEKRRKPHWIWPANPDDQTTNLSQLLSPLDQFNAEAKKVCKASVSDFLKQLPEQLLVESNLSRVFALADRLAIFHQRRFRFALNASVVLAIIGYVVQQVWVTTPGKIGASLFLTFALLVICLSNRGRNLERYLEYRALAEVLRIACFWRLAGVTATPTDSFLNQHWGNLLWIRSAVNALWIPDTSIKPDLDLVKTFWIDDQQRFYQKRSGASGLAARCARWLTNICFAASVTLAWLGAVSAEWEFFTTMLSSVLLLLVGAISHYTHTRGWEEDASRYRSMAAPFSWCQQIWRYGDEKTRRVLVQELGSECLAELSNWLLIHRNKPISLIKE